MKKCVILLVIVIIFSMECVVRMVEGEILSKTQSIVYRFGDASVPPQFHRSYSITITEDTLSVVVDSYGDVLHQKSFPFTVDDFTKVKQMIKKHKIGNVNLGEDDGCTGGTTESLALYGINGILFSGTVYHCGGNDCGNLGGDIKSLAEGIKIFVPGLRKMLQDSPL